MLKNHYISITKPGIIFGNIITVIGGFYMAKSHANLFLLFFALIGISLVIAAGCVLNNYIDKDIDRLMERTKNRPSALGLISNKKLISFSIILAIFGFSTLFFLVNPLTALIAFVGFIFYVIFYSLFFKRFSSMGTLVGSVSGAVPPVLGYCAASNHFDLGAIILFFILVFWQMPHSYAIAIYRLKDYVAAVIPVLPVVKGLKRTKISMIFYSILFLIASALPYFFSYTGIYYFVLVSLLNIYWIWMIIKGLNAAHSDKWAKKVFLFSILVITLLCLMMVIN